MVMAKRKPGWEALGFSSPEAYEDAKAASEEMLQIEDLMGVDDKLPEGYKMNEGPGKVLTALGLYGDQTDNPVSSRPANIRSYTRPIGGTGFRKLGQYVIPYKAYNTYTPDLEEEFGRQLSKKFKGIQPAMLGGPPQEDDVFADLTTQYNKVEGNPYEDTLKLELRHRGLRSERARDYLKQRGAEEKDPTAGKGEHKLYELIRQLQTGERTRKNLFSWEEDMLRGLENLEAELLEGMSEEERMRLGFIPEKKELGFLDKLMQLMN
jgi:hypothetical protein